MKMKKRIISMILIMGLLAGNLLNNPVKAKTVEVKTNNSNAELKISLLNNKLDYRLDEVAFKIKNKTNKEIKVVNVSIQTKISREWKELQKQKKTVGKRNSIINSESKVYDSVSLKNDYVIPKQGLNAGEYSVYIKYKYKDKFLYTRKSFYVKGLKQESPSVEQEETTPSIENAPDNNPNGGVVEPSAKGETVATQNSVNGVTKTPIIKVKLVNTDFFINKKGKGTAIVFSEADYKKAKKTKIYLSIQRKVKDKWKKYKSYKIIKKSNIAFINKQVKLNKKGKYRMWIKVTFYGKKKLRKQYKTKSKVQVY